MTCHKTNWSTSCCKMKCPNSNERHPQTRKRKLESVGRAGPVSQFLQPFRVALLAWLSQKLATLSLAAWHGIRKCTQSLRSPSLAHKKGCWGQQRVAIASCCTGRLRGVFSTSSSQKRQDATAIRSKWGTVVPMEQFPLERERGKEGLGRAFNSMYKAQLGHTNVELNRAIGLC